MSACPLTFHHFLFPFDVFFTRELYQTSRLLTLKATKKAGDSDLVGSVIFVAKSELVAVSVGLFVQLFSCLQ